MYHVRPVGSNIRTSWSPDCTTLYSTGGNEGVHVATRGSTTTAVVTSTTPSTRSLSAGPDGTMYYTAAAGVYSFTSVVPNTAAAFATGGGASAYGMAWENATVLW